MVALLGSTPTAATAAAEPTVLLAIPQGAWRAMMDLAQGTRTVGRTHHHLRAALDQITQVDCVLHAAVMVRSGEVQGLSAHTRRAGAERALLGWLREQPELWPGLTLDDWHHLLEAGLAPVELVESTTVMITVDVSRPEKGDRYS